MQLSHKHSTLVFAAATATVYQEPHFWTKLRTGGQELFTFFCFDPKISCVGIHCNTRSNLNSWNLWVDLT